MLAGREVAWDFLWNNKTSPPRVLHLAVVERLEFQ
jgi:hypothetical protein